VLYYQQADLVLSRCFIPFVLSVRKKPQCTEDHDAQEADSHQHQDSLQYTGNYSTGIGAGICLSHYPEDNDSPEDPAGRP
jgi:hypothetical protein